jgi:DASS family divalent anion:Na+ symporter
VTEAHAGRRRTLLGWALVCLAGLLVLLVPVPAGITPQAWRLLAIFAATIVGSIVRPVPAAAIVLIGVSTIALTRTLPVEEALGGYADPIVWLVLAAFLISRGMLKTGLGRRIAFLFIRFLGRRSLGLGYALVATDTLLASVIPSNAARAGGILFPIGRSLAEAFDSRPGPTAARLGGYLMPLLYQCDVVVSATFLTGQASNALIAKFAAQVTAIQLTYPRWLIGTLVPALISLVSVPFLLYRLNPPEITHTPAAAESAAAELRRMGPMSGPERLMLLVFALVALLWMTSSLHQISYTIVALVGICVLLITGVLDWEDVLSERGAWDVFIWYGGLVRMAEALGESGLTKRFAETVGGFTAGWDWGAAMVVLVLVYFFAHYAFASITAHATAMYIPFLIVLLAAGAPPALAVLSLAYFSNLSACLTHYGTTPGPIYFGAGYVTQRTWWRLGFIVALAHLLIWGVVGSLWWKVLGWW